MCVCMYSRACVCVCMYMCQCVCIFLSNAAASAAASTAASLLPHQPLHPRSIAPALAQPSCHKPFGVGDDVACNAARLHARFAAQTHEESVTTRLLEHYTPYGRVLCTLEANLSHNKSKRASCVRGVCLPCECSGISSSHSLYSGETRHEEGARALGRHQLDFGEVGDVCVWVWVWVWVWV